MSTITKIQIQRCSTVMSSRTVAIVHLNSITHTVGVPVMVRYNTPDGSIDTITAIGIKSGVGPDCYSITSFGENNYIGGVLDNIPDVTSLIHNISYIAKNSDNNSWALFYIDDNGNIRQMRDLQEGEKFYSLEDSHTYYYRYDELFRDDSKNLVIGDREAEIDKLMSAVFPMELEAAIEGHGDGRYEIGQTVAPIITWTLKKDNVSFLVERAQVDGVEVENPSSGRYIAPRIGESHTYHLRVWYSGATYSIDIPVIFGYKKYWGVISNPEDFRDIYGLHSTWADTWTMEETMFNCRGGYHPVYVIPSSLWPGDETFRMWIGGFRTTDFSHTTKTLYNESESEAEFEVITLDTRQTGILSIKFE